MCKVLKLAGVLLIVIGTVGVSQKYAQAFFQQTKLGHQCGTVKKGNATRKWECQNHGGCMSTPFGICDDSSTYSFGDDWIERDYDDCRVALGADCVEGPAKHTCLVFDGYANKNPITGVCTTWVCTDSVQQWDCLTTAPE